MNTNDSQNADFSVSTRSTFSKRGIVFFDYDQTELQFVFQYKKYRTTGVALLCIWMIYYTIQSMAMFLFNVPLATVGVLIPTLVIPLVLLLGIWILFSYKEIYSLNNHALECVRDCFWHSSKKRIPIDELRSFHVRKNARGQSNKATGSKVTVKTTGDELAIFDCMGNVVTTEECRWLAVTMQEILQKIQSTTGKPHKKWTAPLETKWRFCAGNNKFVIVHANDGITFKLILHLFALIFFGLAITCLLAQQFGFLPIPKGEDWLFRYFLCVFSVTIYFCILRDFVRVLKKAFWRVSWTFTKSEIVRNVAVFGVGFSNHFDMTSPCSIDIRKHHYSSRSSKNKDVNIVERGKRDITITNEYSQKTVILNDLTVAEARWLINVVLNEHSALLYPHPPILRPAPSVQSIITNLAHLQVGTQS